MLSRIVRWSLHRPGLIAAACLAMLIYGAVLIPSAKLDTFPRLSPAQVTISTEAPGLVSEQVELLITRPIETAVIGGGGVAGVHSQSVQGLSIVTVELARGADPFRVRQALSESLSQAAAELPAGVGAPRLSPLTDGSGDILKIGFTSASLTPFALRDVVQWTVRPRLLSTPGVADVAVFGGSVRRIEVRARPGDLVDSDLGFADVYRAVNQATGVAGAGFIDTPQQRVLIDPHGQAATAEDVAAGQIQVTGSVPVRISDIADVVDAPAPPVGDALVMGGPGVVVGVSGQYGANTVETTGALERALVLLRPTLAAQGVVVTQGLDRPAGFIGGAVQGIVRDLLIGAALLILVLLVFLRDWRATLISVVSIPLCVVATLVILTLMGWTLNLMTLGGLAVALGLIVDDAVLDIENILSRLRDAQEQHSSRAQAVLQASLEVRAPVIYATLLIVIALSPVLFIGGVQGALLAPLAVSIIVASLASLVVALCVTPALALMLLSHVGPDTEPWLLDRLKTAYAAWLERACAHPRLAASATVGLAVVGLLIAFGLRGAFLPSFHDGHLTAEIDAPAGTSLAVMSADGALITRDLLKDRQVALVAEQIGRAETGRDAWGPEHAAFSIELAPGLTAAGQDRARQRVQHSLDAYPGLGGRVRTGFDGAALGSATRPDIAITVFGSDLDALDGAAAQIARVIGALPGARAVAVAVSPKAPVMRADLNFQRLALYGLSSADVLDTLQAVFEGRRAARIYQDGRAIDLTVTGPDSLRQDPETVQAVLLRSSTGVSAPLRSVANVYLSDGRARIEHDGGFRRQIVTADLSGADARDFARQARDAIARRVRLAPGAYVEITTPAADANGQATLMRNAAIAGAAVLGLLLVAFGDLRTSGLILGSTVFAFVGGVLAVAATGGVVSLGSYVGFITLFGISTRNAILMISRLDDLVGERGAAWSLATVLIAARERLTPILISAVVIAVALAPLAVEAGQPGREILGPMVFVILGGLASSTLLGLLLTPSLLLWLWTPTRLRRRGAGSPA